MKENTIRDLAYMLKTRKEQQLPAPLFFLGAGASRTGNIPLASEIAADILKDYADCPGVARLADSERTYPRLMDALWPSERHKLLEHYLSGATINAAHLYLAQFMYKGYADHILTVNFDNLMLRALALYNIFPPTYDIAILKTPTSAHCAEQSVIYLHGQSHGFWLLNTEEEFEMVKDIIPGIIAGIRERPWIILGYSGNDPVFNYIRKIGRFNDGLYWIGYNDEPPSSKVREFLDTQNTHTFYIKGHDADSFMLELNAALSLGQPDILTHPFTSLRTMLDGITDIDGDKYTEVKQRLVIAKSQVDKAIEQFENAQAPAVSDTALNEESQIKKLIEIITNKTFDDNEDYLMQLYAECSSPENRYSREFKNILGTAFWGWADTLQESVNDKESYIQLILDKYKKASILNPEESGIFNNWGTALYTYAKTRSGQEADSLFSDSFDKYSKAASLNPDDCDIFTNWGTALSIYAKTRSGQEADSFFSESFDKYSGAASLNSNDFNIFYNWGIVLSYYARIKSGQEADSLFSDSFDKYSKAASLNPDDSNIFNNWGSTLFDYGRTKSGKVADSLFSEAFEKYAKATSLSSNDFRIFHNWGIALSDYAKTKSGQKADSFFIKSFDKFTKATLLNPKHSQIYNNWGNALFEYAKTKSGQEADSFFSESFDNYSKAACLKPDGSNIFNNWGIVLSYYAKTKSGQEADSLFAEAFDKYSKAASLNPDDSEIFNNWGITLSDYAQTKPAAEASNVYRQALETLAKGERLKKHSCLYNIACVYALTGRQEEAIAALLDLIASGDTDCIQYMFSDPDLASIAGDERLQKYKKKPPVVPISPPPA